MKPLAVIVVAAVGCDSTPSKLIGDAAGDGLIDAAPTPPGCACPGTIAFALNETAQPVESGSEIALINGPEFLLGQPGPPGFGAAACFSTGSFLQFPGAAFTTLGAHHTLEILVQPLSDGVAVDWSNDGRSGWRAQLTSQTLLASFCAGECTTPTLLPQGKPRWVAAQWYHVALVRDGDAVRGYLDGVLAGEVTGLSQEDVEVPLGLLVGDPTLGFQGCFAWMRMSPCACYSGDTIALPAGEAE